MSHIKVIFIRNGRNIILEATDDMMFAELVLKFARKEGINFSEDEVKFLFNSRELKTDSYKSLAEIGIRNMTRIDVVDNGKKFFGA